MGLKVEAPACTLWGRWDGRGCRVAERLDGVHCGSWMSKQPEIKDHSSGFGSGSLGSPGSMGI